jgi:spermidine dehydrogenase
MKKTDEQLGMYTNISRRDFINGVAATTAGAMLLPSIGVAQEAAAAGLTGAQPGGFPGLETGLAGENYPPRRSGMRGSHPGSFEAAHQLRDNPKESLASAVSTGEEYDLVIVGAGISGLSAAYFFIKDVGRDCKILILDNHDDFGGHAKRNEVVYNGKTIVINGGTLDIEAPAFYSQQAKDMLKEIGIDLDRYRKANEQNRTLYRKLGLRNAYFFDKETWGKDTLLVNANTGGRREGFSREFLDRTPLSEKAKSDMERLFDSEEAPDYWPELSEADKRVKLARMSYEDYLLNIVKVDKQVVWFFQHFGEDVFCVGADATPALFAWQMGQPGFAGLKLSVTSAGVLDELPGTQHGRQSSGRGGEVHFPDGNATVARLLVRWLIPDALPGTTQESVGMAKVQYDLLDRKNQTTCIRLGSTVLHAANEGAKGRETGVAVTYSKGGKLYNVKGNACVMACWNMFIPYLVPDLSEEQKTALHYAVKGPIVYTSVAVKNWQAWKAAGVSTISAPTMYHTSVHLTEAVGLGDLEFPQTPDEPIFLHMEKIMVTPGKPRKDQHRLGRYELLNTSFATFERSIREQLDRMLSSSGFDAKRDIVSIIVNRWPHGYAYTYNGLFEPLEWVYTASDNRPCVIARKTHGLIAIANSDAGASPHTDTAIWEAHRAVDDIINRRAMPYLAQTRAEAATQS